MVLVGNTWVLALWNLKMSGYVNIGTTLLRTLILTLKHNTVHVNVIIHKFSSIQSHDLLHKDVTNLLSRTLFDSPTKENSVSCKTNRILKVSYSGKNLESKMTLKKTLRLPELNPSMTVLMKASEKVLLPYVLLI